MNRLAAERPNLEPEWQTKDRGRILGELEAKNGFGMLHPSG